MNGEIDYSMSIKNFKTMTDTNDDELAIKYLSKYDWDETVLKYLLNRKQLMTT
jgi:hypothetical protein